jgi:hypothetical protein
LALFAVLHRAPFHISMSVRADRPLVSVPTASQNRVLTHDTEFKVSLPLGFVLLAVDQLEPLHLSMSVRFAVDPPCEPTAMQKRDEVHDAPTRKFVRWLGSVLADVLHRFPFHSSTSVLSMVGAT